MSKDPTRRSPCPIANTLDLLGDKWSLLLVRDLIDGGKKTFGALLASPEKIPTNLLAARLKRLERAGLVKLDAYSEPPPRYEYSLTARGKALGPVLDALMQWGRKQFAGTMTIKQLQAGQARRERAATRSGQVT